LVTGASQAPLCPRRPAAEMQNLIPLGAPGRPHGHHTCAADGAHVRAGAVADRVPRV